MKLPLSQLDDSELTTHNFDGEPVSIHIQL